MRCSALMWQLRIPSLESPRRKMVATVHKVREYPQRTTSSNPLLLTQFATLSAPQNLEHIPEPCPPWPPFLSLTLHASQRSTPLYVLSTYLQRLPQLSTSLPHPTSANTIPLFLCANASYRCHVYGKRYEIIRHAAAPTRNTSLPGVELEVVA